MKKTFVLVAPLLLGLIISSCSTPTPVTPATVIVTVVNTVPVEVTRLAPVQQTVEVTRQVVVTQIVQEPVTITPSPTLEDTTNPPAATPSPEVTATQIEAASPTAAPTFYPTATFPEEKTQGYSRLKLVNETQAILSVQISGPMSASYTLSPGSHPIEPVREGLYEYVITQEGKVMFRGTMNITNPDKHELHIKPEKAIFLVP